MVFFISSSLFAQIQPPTQFQGIGIGTPTNPSFLFDLKGLARIDGQLILNNNSEIYTGANGQWRVSDNNHRITFTTSTSPNKLEFREWGNIVLNPGGGNGRNSFVADYNGNIGIGLGVDNTGNPVLPNPNNKLEVEGNSSFKGNSFFDGNVGVGTNPDPNLKLDVAGNSRVKNGDLKVENGKITFFNNGISTILANDANHSLNFNPTLNRTELREWGDIVLNPGGGSGRNSFIADANGNFGIGLGATNGTPNAPAPSNRLEVNGNTKIVGESNVSGDGYFGGNVNIGNTTPNSNFKLDINGATRIKTGDLSLDNGKIVLNGTRKVIQGGFDESHSIDLGTDEWKSFDDIKLKSGYRFPTITSSSVSTIFLHRFGNVGIGNENPQAKLDVSGAILATGSIKGAAFESAGKIKGASLQITDNALEGAFLSTDADGNTFWKALPAMPGSSLWEYTGTSLGYNASPVVVNEIRAEIAKIQTLSASTAQMALAHVQNLRIGAPSTTITGYVLTKGTNGTSEWRKNMMDNQTDWFFNNRPGELFLWGANPSTAVTANYIVAGYNNFGVRGRAKFVGVPGASVGETDPIVQFGSPYIINNSQLLLAVSMNRFDPANPLSEHAGISATRMNVGGATMGTVAHLIIQGGGGTGNNLGIGPHASAPTEKLSVNGNIFLSNKDFSNVSIKLRHANETASSWGLEILQKPDLAGSITCYGRDLEVTSGWDKTLTLGHIQFNNSGGKVVIPGGRLGIGSNDPVRTLHVNSVMSDGGIAAFQNSNSRLFINKDQATSGINIDIYNTDGFRAPLNFQPFGGSVGIGTTNPTEKLEVNGNIKATNFKFADGTSMSTAVFNLTNINGVQMAQSNLPVNITSTLKLGTNSLYLSGTSPSSSTNSIYTSDEPLYINSNASFNQNTLLNVNGGNVSIGNSNPNPNYKLDVIGDTRIYGSLTISDSYGKIVFPDGSIQTTAARNFTVDKSFRINDNQGYIQIFGTNKLHGLNIAICDLPNSWDVVGSKPSDVVISTRGFDNTGGRTGDLWLASTNQGKSVRLVANKNQFGEGGVFVHGDMSVLGKLGAKDICVNNNGNWCDYVFDTDYKLPKLSEVEKYINKNHHLPEIPAASTVEKEGINVSEMLKLQMKKIEELTLYVIELEKKINELKK